MYTWSRYLFLILMVLFFSGCAGHYAVQEKYYDTQIELIRAQNNYGEYYHKEELTKKPGKLLDLQLREDGTVAGISIDVSSLTEKPKQLISMKDIGRPENHPFLQFWKDTLYSPVAQIGVGFWGAGRLVDSIGKNAGGNVSNSNSGNSGSYNDSGGGGMALTTGAGNANFDASSYSDSSNKDSYNSADNEETYADSFNQPVSNNEENYTDSYNPDSSINDSYKDYSGQDNSQQPIDNSINESQNPIYDYTDQNSGDVNNYTTP